MTKDAGRVAHQGNRLAGIVEGLDPRSPPALLNRRNVQAREEFRLAVFPNEIFEGYDF